MLTEQIFIILINHIAIDHLYIYFPLSFYFWFHLFRNYMVNRDLLIIINDFIQVLDFVINMSTISSLLLRSLFAPL